MAQRSASAGSTPFDGGASAHSRASGNPEASTWVPAFAGTSGAEGSIQPCRNLPLIYRHRADRRCFGADHLERQTDQGETVPLDPIEVLQVRHGDDAVLAQRPGIVKHPR